MTGETDHPLKKIENEKTENTAADKAPVKSLAPDEIGDIPPEVIKEVRSFMSMSMGRTPHPVVDKLTEEHISTILEHINEQDGRDYKTAGYIRRYFLLILAIFIALFVFLTVYFVGQEKSDLYFKVLSYFGTFVAGLIGGLGGGSLLKDYLTRGRS